MSPRFNKAATLSALKELARLVIMAAVGAVIAWLTQLQEGLDPTTVWPIVITVVLRALDKYFYKKDGTNVFKF